MNFYRTELLHAAVVAEITDAFAATLAADYGDAVAMLAARNPDNQTAFENLAHKVVQLVPESKIDELFEHHVDAIDFILEQEYAVTDPQRAAATLTARSLIRRKEVSHVTQ